MNGGEPTGAPEGASLLLRSTGGASSQSPFFDSTDKALAASANRVVPPAAATIPAITAALFLCRALQQHSLVLNPQQPPGCRSSTHQHSKLTMLKQQQQQQQQMQLSALALQQPFRCSSSSNCGTPLAAAAAAAARGPQALALETSASAQREGRYEGLEDGEAVGDRAAATAAEKAGVAAAAVAASALSAAAAALSPTAPSKRGGIQWGEGMMHTTAGDPDT
ncbi:hypothetical protein Esti_006869 [Eimeria stiedai]